MRTKVSIPDPKKKITYLFVGGRRMRGVNCSGGFSFSHTDLEFLFVYINQVFRN